MDEQLLDILASGYRVSIANVSRMGTIYDSDYVLLAVVVENGDTKLSACGSGKRADALRDAIAQLWRRMDMLRSLS